MPHLILIQPWDGAAVIVPILQMGELRLSPTGRPSRGGLPGPHGFKAGLLGALLRCRRTEGGKGVGCGWEGED